MNIFFGKNFYMYICTDFFWSIYFVTQPTNMFRSSAPDKYDKSVYLIIIFPLDRKVCDTLSNIWSWYFSTSFWCQSSLHFWEKNMFLKLYIKHSSLVTKKPWPIDNHWKYIIYLKNNTFCSRCHVSYRHLSSYVCIYLEISPWIQHSFLIF